MQFDSRRLVCVLALGTFTHFASAGPDWVEGDHGLDAGALPGGSQVTAGSNGLNKISGMLSFTDGFAGGQGGLDLQDMYLIRITDPSLFCASTVPQFGGDAGFDSRLWLFKVDGTGLLGNDDTALNLVLGNPLVSGSTLGPFACDETEASVPKPGLYYLAVSKAHMPLSMTGPIFRFDDADQCGPGELSGPDGSGGAHPIVGWADNEVDFDIQVQGGRAGSFAKVFTLTGDATFNPQVASNTGELEDQSGYDDWNMSWNFSSDNDPTQDQASIGSGFVIENTMADVADASANHLTFSITIQMKLKVPTLASVLGGNAAITLLTRPSFSSNAGRLTSVSQPVWNARLNNTDVGSLFAHPFQLSSPATPLTGSTAVTSATLTPFASSDEVEGIGVRMVFDLSPGEKATFIGVFALLPMALGSEPTETLSYTIALCGVDTAVTLATLPLDIEHGHCPNLFRPGSNGILNVTIPGATTYDVHDIDLSSVRLSRTDDIGGEVTPNEGPPGPHSTYQDKATPFTGTPCNCHSLNGDGLADLWMKFQSHLVSDVLELDDLPCGQLVELQVTGEFLDRTPFTSRDCILIAHDDDNGGCDDSSLAGDEGKVKVRCAVAGTWIDADSVDAFIDDGGFSNFERYYPAGSMVTLVAPPVSSGQVFKGWMINGKTMIKSAQVTIPANIKPNTVEAMYRSPQ